MQAIKSFQAHSLTILILAFLGNIPVQSLVTTSDLKSLINEGRKLEAGGHQLEQFCTFIWDKNSKDSILKVGMITLSCFDFQVVSNIMSVLMFVCYSL